MKRFGRQFLSLLLALTMVLSLSGLSLAAGEDTGFQVEIWGTAEKNTMQVGDEDYFTFDTDYTGNYSCSWTCTGSAQITTSTAGDEVTVRATGTGNAKLSVTVTNDQGQRATDSLTLKVMEAQPAPKADETTQLPDPLEVIINDWKLELTEGESKTLSTTVDGGDSALEYKWTTTDPTLATITSSGATATVKALKAGTTTAAVQVTRKSDGSIAADDIRVRVSPASTPLVINALGAQESRVNVGSSNSLSASVTGGSGRYDYQWSADSSVMGIEYNSVSGASAKAYAKGAGKGTVTLYVKDLEDMNNDDSFTWSFTVEEVKKGYSPLNVTMTPATLTLAPAKSAELTLAVSGGSGDYRYNWYTVYGDAAVDQKGGVATVTAGANPCLIRADVQDQETGEVKTVECVLTVERTEGTYNASASATAGSTLDLIPVAINIRNEFERQFDTSLSRSESVVQLDTTKTNVGALTLNGETVSPFANLSVNNLGDLQFQAQSVGDFSTSYRVIEDNKTLSGTIQIKSTAATPTVTVTGANLNSTAVSMYVNSTFALQAQVTPANASYDVEWVSGNTNIVKITGSGNQVTLNAQNRTGSAVVTAKITDKATGKVTTKTCNVSVYTQSRKDDDDRDDTYCSFSPTLNWTLGSDYYGTNLSEEMARQWKYFFGGVLDLDAKIRFSNTGSNKYGVMRLADGTPIKAKTDYTFGDWIDMYFEPYAAGSFTLPYSVDYKGYTLGGTITIKVQTANVTAQMSRSSLELSSKATEYLELSVWSNSGYQVKWTSSNPSVATVSGNGSYATVNTTGTVGTATITATVTDNRGVNVYRTCKVKVEKAGTKLNPKVYTLIGMDYTGTGTSEEMAQQFKSVYGVALNNKQATIRFTTTGNNKVGVMRLADGTAIKADKDYTFEQYINMRTEPVSAGLFTVPYTLTYNGKSLKGNIQVEISPAQIITSFDLADTAPYAFNTPLAGGTGGLQLSSSITNAVGGAWKYIRFSSFSNQVGTLYTNSEAGNLNTSLNVPSSDMSKLYFVPGQLAGVFQADYNVYNTNAEIVANGTLFIRVPGSSAFGDVPNGAYYSNAVNWAVTWGVTSGTGVDPVTGLNAFNPSGTVTRAQAVTFLWRAQGSPDPLKGNNPFWDVPQDLYYTKAVLWAVENGVTAGIGTDPFTGKETFNPDGAVTRDQMLCFLCRTNGANANGPYWETMARDWANSRQLLSGIPTTYSGATACPRSDVVYYLWKNANVA